MGKSWCIVLMLMCWGPYIWEALGSCPICSLYKAVIITSLCIVMTAFIRCINMACPEKTP
jgi:hypothetical protein